jgi:multisubunit Na+/H+ antiporter MnhB subunit
MNKKPGPGMSLIVKVITRLTVGFILLFGIYIVLHGHISPGGGFAGGVIVALSFIHLVLAYGGKFAFKKLDYIKASFFENIGAIMFLTIALIGLAAGYFLYNFLGKGTPFYLLSAGIIPLCNVAICFKVGAGLFIIFIVLTLLKAPGEKK